MADQYIDAAFVRNYLGTNVEGTIEAYTGVGLTQHIESATSLIQSYLRNNGYTTPTTTNDETVKGAVMGAVWQTFASVPEASLPLPENWADHPLRIAYVGILDGSATLDTSVTHTLDTAQAVGGWQASDHSRDTTEGRPQKSSRKNMRGY